MRSEGCRGQETCRTGPCLEVSARLRAAGAEATAVAVRSVFRGEEEVQAGQREHEPASAIRAKQPVAVDERR